MRYSILGGVPSRSYTGTTTFLAMRVIAVANTKEEVKSIVDANYDEAGGLLAVVDLQTGQLADDVPFGKDDNQAEEKRAAEIARSGW